MKKTQQGSTLLTAMIILAVLLILCLTAIKNQMLSTTFNTTEQLNTVAESSSISALNEAFLKANLNTIEIVDSDFCYKEAVANNKVLACPITPKYLLPSPAVGKESLIRNAREYGSNTNNISYLLEQPKWYIVAGCNINGFSTSGMNSCDNKGTGDYLIKIFSVGNGPISESEENDFGYIYTVEYAYVRK